MRSNTELWCVCRVLVLLCVPQLLQIIVSVLPKVTVTRIFKGVMMFIEPEGLLSFEPIPPPTHLLSISTTDIVDKFLSLVDTCHVMGTVHLCRCCPFVRFPSGVSKCESSPSDHQSWGFEISIPCKVYVCVCVYIYIYIYIYILLILCSTWWWSFRPKYVVENNRINYCVLTGFIIILIDHQCMCTYRVETYCGCECLRNEPVVETVWGLLTWILVEYASIGVFVKCVSRGNAALD
jgi:hypothetical protein